MKKNFLLALIGIGVCGIGFGLITPVTIILMEQNHVPTFITGSSTMVGYLSVILFSGYTGKLIDRCSSLQGKVKTLDESLAHDSAEGSGQ